MPGRALFLHLAAAMLAPAAQNAHADLMVLPGDEAERLGSQGRALNPETPIVEPAETTEPGLPDPDGDDRSEPPPSDRPNPPPGSAPPASKRPAQAPAAEQASAAPAAPDRAPPRDTQEQSSDAGHPGDDGGALFGVPRDTVEPNAPPTSHDSVHLSLEANGGVSLRLDKEPRGFDTEEPLDMTFGVGVWFSPARRYALALAYRNMGLGGARSATNDDDIAVQRDLDMLWLGGRAYPILGEQLGLFLQLEIGGTWQRMAAHGTAQGVRFSCTASEGPALMLGGGVGVDVILDNALSFVAVVDGAAHRLGKDVVDDCAPGSGSVMNMTAQVGFMYRINLGGEPAG